LIIGYARVSTTEQNAGLEDVDLKLAFDASVDLTNGTLYR
jgi:DNA invertase Pin-like site-specific DNA recombinase